MTFAEFYHIRDGRYVEGVGDRSVIILDGRCSLYNQKFISLQECRKRGYDGFRIAKGRFTEPHYLTAIVPANAAA